MTFYCADWLETRIDPRGILAAYQTLALPHHKIRDAQVQNVSMSRLLDRQFITLTPVGGGERTFVPVPPAERAGITPQKLL